MTTHKGGRRSMTGPGVLPPAGAAAPRVAGKCRPPTDEIPAWSGARPGSLSAVDAAARALAADLHGRDVWPDLPEYLRGEWRRRVDLVLRRTGGER